MTITSLQNPLVKHFVHLRQNKDYRYDHRTVMIEGIKLIEEICPYFHTKTIITNGKVELSQTIVADQYLVANDAVIDKISALSSHEGVVAEIEMPPESYLNNLWPIVVLDGINDPGNLGTILRTALALGWKGAYLLNNCCDPWNDKALRAAKGATFHLPFKQGSWEEFRKILAKNKLNPLVADLTGHFPEKYKKEQKIALILGNEAHGVSEEAENYEKITIPMSGKMESLNVAVAAGILIYSLQGQ